MTNHNKGRYTEQSYIHRAARAEKDVRKLFVYQMPWFLGPSKDLMQEGIDQCNRVWCNVQAGWMAGWGTLCMPTLPIGLWPYHVLCNLP